MKRIALLVLVTAMLGSVPAAHSEADKDPTADLRAKLAAKLPGGLKADDVRPSPVAGLYEVNLGGQIAYVSADGNFLISGDMFDINSRTNVTETHRVDVRMKALSKVKEDDMIVFSPTGAVKHTITVFTDVDCAYCRKLHSEISELNKLGIRVRYLAYPRSGPGTESWFKAQAVWCAKDRQDAITRAKRGEEPKQASCNSKAVEKEYALGETVGVHGTPAIITDKGEYIGGYLPPQKLLAALDGTEPIR